MQLLRSYVGETKRTARIRSGEHKKQSINPLKDTPFFRHISSTDHSLNFDNPDVLDIEPHYFRRITSELVHINSQINGINIQKDFEKLNSIYTPLFNRFERANS